MKLNKMNTEDTKGLTGEKAITEILEVLSKGEPTDYPLVKLGEIIAITHRAKLQEKPELTIPNYLIRRLKKETDPTVIKADLREWLQDHQPPQRVELSDEDLKQMAMELAKKHDWFYTWDAILIGLKAIRDKQPTVLDKGCPSCGKTFNQVKKCHNVKCTNPNLKQPSEVDLEKYTKWLHQQDFTDDSISPEDWVEQYLKTK